MSEAKPHCRVKITASFVKKLNPCADGWKAGKRLLPVTVSTDPEQNIKLALDLHQIGAMKEVDWLADAVAPGRIRAGCSCEACNRNLPPTAVHAAPSDDEMSGPMIIAQNLAEIADTIATSGGK